LGSLLPKVTTGYGLADTDVS